jgi:anthranilate phosphoribosyltransferase
VSLKELLEGLGVHIEVGAVEWERIFADNHIGFIWSELVCPPLGKIRHSREQMGLHTLINTVEKVINPIAYDASSSRRPEFKFCAVKDERVRSFGTQC